MSGKYETVVIDFPWEVKMKLLDGEHYGYRPIPYKTMTDEAVLKFPINDFAAPRCDLFLWSITSKVPLTFKILEAWGFRYMDLLAWDKVMGVAVNGIYRVAEWVVYGYRGTMGLRRDGHIIPNLIRQRRTEHSEKPDAFYESLRANTKEPRIDIFARKRHFGFEGWGDQAQKEIQLPILEAVESQP